MLSAATGKGRDLVVLVVCLLLLAACGREAVRGDQSVLAGIVYLDCSRECRHRGACNQSGNTGDDVVYLGVSPAFPGVSAVAFRGLAVGTAVEVLDRRTVAGVEQLSNKTVSIRFYRVQEPASDAAGWVPGFCIADQAP